jgi:hypothetical protein
MNSFTSSSKPWLVGAFVLLTLLGTEGVTRTRLFQASKDLSRFTTYDQRSRKLATSTGVRVAFVGNSWTDRGIDEKEFARILGVSCDKFVADGSYVNTWYWIIECEFWKRNLKPDLIIMNFCETGLEDGKEIEIGRLAQFFTDRSDWTALFQRDIKGFEPRVEFVLSSFWATYAVRERIKERTLGLIPDYKIFTQKVHDVNVQHDKKPIQGSKGIVTLQTLERLCDRACEKETRLLFVAFPALSNQPGPGYAVPEEARELIAKKGQLFVDLRVVPGLEPRYYDDAWHLNPEGQAIYTRYLAKSLLSYLPSCLTP